MCLVSSESWILEYLLGGIFRAGFYFCLASVLGGSYSVVRAVCFMYTFLGTFVGGCL